MELESERFRDKLMALLASPQVAVFGSLPACRYGHDLPFVEAIKQRPDTGRTSCRASLTYLGLALSLF
jgi:nucleoside-triphosphatase